MTYTDVLAAEQRAFANPSRLAWGIVVRTCALAARAVRDLPYLGRAELSQLDLLGYSAWWAAARRDAL